MTLSKKILTSLLALTCIFQGSTQADDSSSSAPDPTFVFFVVPKVVVEKESHHDNHVILVAALAPAYGAPGAYIEAYRRDDETHFLYSKPFKQFLRKNHLKKSQFHLIKHFLKKQLKLAKKNPNPYITTLDGFLQSGGVLKYTLDIQAIETSSSSSSSSSFSSSSSTAVLPPPCPPAVLTFLTVPELIKVGSSQVKARIAGVLDPVYNTPGAQVEAYQKHGKTHYIYSKPMREFMKANGFTKAEFAPLEAYLAAQIAQAEITPNTYVSYMDSYINGGPVPPFSFAITPI